MNTIPTPKDDLEQIIVSARRLGVEIDQEEALQWLAAMAVTQSDEVTLDTRHGVYGQKISMLDFSPEELNYFREIGKIVEIPDRPGQVETALALSGSAAQSKIQSFPGDCDFFERVNLKTATRAEASQLMSEVIREKILSTARGKTFRFMEAKFGSYPFSGKRDGIEFKKGGSVSWNLDEVEKGKLWVEDETGKAQALTWSEVANDPGWTKLDWVVAHPPKRNLANASNNLDVTWESPDGEIVPLDGQLDPYFQEVYLDAESIPLFSKLAKHVAADALDGYLAQLEKEVKKYTGDHPNYGKAAKRMYNVFRLSGRYAEAVYLRELFDEPATLLYQIASTFRTVDEASQDGSEMDQSIIFEQLDQLIQKVLQTLPAEEKTDMVQRLLRFHALLAITDSNTHRLEEVGSAQAEVMEAVNTYFYDRLTGLPSIKTYIEDLRTD